MKKRVLLVIAILGFGTIILLAQAPPKPPDDPSLGGNGPIGGAPAGAPIDGGLGILIVLSAGYGTKKLFNTLKQS